jgi:hypothetical protein
MRRRNPKLGWIVIIGAVAGSALFALRPWRRERATGLSLDAQVDAERVEFERQLQEASNLREFAYSIALGEHQGHFERKDYIAFILFNRCLQTHQAAEIVARQSLIDDVWVLVRSLVEHAVNAVYMLQIADAKTADDFNDYQHYLSYQALLDLKATDEPMLRQLVSLEEEERERLQFERVRGRFDGKRGDKWCADDALFKRAAQVDAAISAQLAEKRSDLKWLVNTLWRYASGYTHGTARSLSSHIEETDDGVRIKRKPTYAEAAKAMESANSALYQVLLPIDVRLGGKHATELNRRFDAWVSGH